jgi:hypothetical protein
VRWDGERLLCTANKEFSTKIRADCETNGYKASGFFEVDTGWKSDWSQDLNDQDSTPRLAPPTTIAKDLRSFELEPGHPPIVKPLEPTAEKLSRSDVAGDDADESAAACRNRRIKSCQRQRDSQIRACTNMA